MNGQAVTQQIYGIKITVEDTEMPMVEPSVESDIMKVAAVIIALFQGGYPRVQVILGETGDIRRFSEFALFLANFGRGFLVTARAKDFSRFCVEELPGPETVH